ncbi:hypothetical protein SAMN04515663_101402 [Alcanivorax sp. DSM 26293]|jgi:hypothetical protein|uniref:hypothetical protein n=1 Tax=Alcanivorax sp. DSM 26293 TaxID=1798238 RepID=UPI0008A05387|nr:hypothetical protein [Alcanivorax sp. DSM 26293]SEF44623.1 hypothetical protein SAMN04515663_101402 [Alcanivorax sp. DSM 26293]
MLTDQQRAALRNMPRKHQPANYAVLVGLREHGQRKAKQAHTTYVRASSEQRALMVGYWVVKNLYAGPYRKLGLTVSRATSARAMHPVKGE